MEMIKLVVIMDLTTKMYFRSSSTGVTFVPDVLSAERFFSPEDAYKRLERAAFDTPKRFEGHVFQLVDIFACVVV